MLNNLNTGENQVEKNWFLFLFMSCAGWYNGKYNNKSKL